MGKEAIVNFSDDRGLIRRKPVLRETLTDDQIDQIRYARHQGVSWKAISLYFKEEYGMDYGTTTWQATFSDGI